MRGLEGSRKGGGDNGSLRAPLRAQPVQWDLGTHISHNGTEREGDSGTAGGRRGSHSLIDSETQRLFFYVPGVTRDLQFV